MGKRKPRKSLLDPHKPFVDKLLEEGEAVLGGQMQTATVLFTDIRSFTTISEQLGPHETVTMLNEYFSIMVDLILEHGGILDKYIGDAVMAWWGATTSQEDDAERAVLAGLAILGVHLVFYPWPDQCASWS